MRTEPAEGFVVGVSGEGRARRSGFLAPDLLSVRLVDLLGLRTEKRHLFFAEAVGQEHVSVPIECGELSFVQQHGFLLGLRQARRADSAAASSFNR